MVVEPRRRIRKRGARGRRGKVSKTAATTETAGDMEKSRPDMGMFESDNEAVRLGSAALLPGSLSDCEDEMESDQEVGKENMTDG